MLGIILIAVLAALIILTDIYLPWLVSKSRRGPSATVGGAEEPAKYSKLSSWEEDDILQLQRQAFEGQGIGPWTDKNGSRVPVMAEWDIKFRKGKDLANNGWQGLHHGPVQSAEAFERLLSAKSGSEQEKSPVQFSSKSSFRGA